MKRRGKRFFSLIFVPDRERDPKSLSLSYTWGLLLVVLLIILGLHLLFGIFGYYRWFQSTKNITNLSLENERLRVQNAKIETIYHEFLEIKAMDEKIRKAFGSTLGIQEQTQEVLAEYRPAKPATQPVHTDVSRTQSLQNNDQEVNHYNGLYFLTRSKPDFMNPDRIPTLLPVDGYLTAHFQKGGWFLGRRHYGIDIAAEAGAPIKAAGAGTVILADWTPDYGNMVIISHGDDLYTYYGHAKRLLVDQGYQVKRGQPIALLGNSGISSAPHLHFEIWHGNMPLDPETYLLTEQSRKQTND